MYVPPKFAEEDTALLWAFIDEYPFAILLTDDPVRGRGISHVPVIFPDKRRDVLHTHLARANPQAFLENETCATVIFTGPHGYISPTWYETVPAVPTWNYTAVHVHGAVYVLTDEKDRKAVIRALAQRFEGTGAGAWDFDALPDRFRDGQMKGIVALEIRVDSMVGKFKLSQNRTLDDRAGVVRNLETSERPDDKSLAAFMKERPGIV